MTEISAKARAMANGLQLHLIRAHGLPEEFALTLDAKQAARHHQPPHDHMVPTRRWEAVLKMIESDQTV